MKRVLLVEDDESILLGVSLILQEDGYIVDEALSETQAMDRAFANHPDVAIVDFRLNGTGGVAVVERLRTIQPGLPAVLITGMVDATEVQNDAKRLNMALLQKPFEVKTLSDMIGTMLQDARTADRTVDQPVLKSEFRE